MSKEKKEQSVAGVRFTPQSFQEPFVYSTGWFPCRVAPWGDGKTLCMIIKGLILSMMYPGNEGLIVRKRYKALQKSTIRDFEHWTHLKVPDQKQSVVIPGFDSTIHFSHAESMDDFRYALQGMNLGWAAIEQGDELLSGEVFDMLKGRLRRILTPNDEIQKRLIALGTIDDYIEKFAGLSAVDRDRIEHDIIHKLGLPVRQINVIANACGHNWIWKRWIDPKLKGKLQPGYEYFEGKPFENVENLPKSTLIMWEGLRVDSPKKYNRFVLNSHEDYDIEGSYYAAKMSDALKDGRVEIDGLYDETQVVYTFWDLGVDNNTAIWFVQFVGEEIRLVDYYENNNEGMKFYSDILTEKGYTYAEHWLPHDAEQRIQGEAVTTRLDILRRLRRHEDIYIVARHSVQERIEAVRSLLNKCKFDSKCEDGVECMNLYHQERNEAKSTDERTVFQSRPAKEYSDGADAFGYMSIVYRYQSIDGQVLGLTGMHRVWMDDECEVGVVDLLEI